MPAKAKTNKNVEKTVINTPMGKTLPVGSKTKAKTVPKKTKEPVAPAPEPELTDVEIEGEEGESKLEKKNRMIPTKESIVTGFEELITVIDDEIERLRESQQKSKGIKFLRSLGKKVKTLRGHAVRVMKQKQKTNRKNNTNSGFLKPVKISKEMASFTGWNPEILKSRVDVTKALCAYIKDNNLQNPEDRRQILADKKLTKLLEYNKDTDKPLTYYRIQTYMKKHFSNPDPALNPTPTPTAPVSSK